MSKALVLYHGDCPDGAAAAWAAWRKMGDGADYVPVWYNEPCPVDVTGRQVFMVDFCYKRPEMVDIGRRASSLVVLDHHKTALAACQGLEDELRALRGDDGVTVVFDMYHSGAVLAWWNFHPGESLPMMVRYVEDRDLWKFALPHSKEIAALAMTYPRTPAGYAEFAERFRFIEEASAKAMPNEYDPVVREGVGALRANDRTVDALVASARWVRIDGHKVKLAHAPLLWSEVAGLLAVGAPFGATYLYRGNGIKQYSLRVRSGDFDVSALAAKYGGGGHTKAAGFEVHTGQADPFVPCDPPGTQSPCLNTMARSAASHILSYPDEIRDQTLARIERFDPEFYALVAEVIRGVK